MYNCENCRKRKWLELLLQDKDKEDEDLALMGVEMLRDAARSTIWEICSYYGLCFGVPGNTSRLFEQYVASLVRRLTWHAGREYAGLVMPIVGPQLPLIVACCFHLTAKSSSMRVHITHGSIRDYFLSRGVYEYTIPRIRDMEKEIFKKIGYRLPLYSCVDMAGMLAAELEVPAPTLKLVYALVEGSEAHRHFIEYGVLSVVNQRHILAHDARVKTLHLAAACVVAAIQYDFGLSEAMRVSERLEKFLRVSKTYLKTLSNVILANAAGQPTNYY